MATMKITHCSQFCAPQSATLCGQTLNKDTSTHYNPLNFGGKNAENADGSRKGMTRRGRKQTLSPHEVVNHMQGRAGSGLSVTKKSKTSETGIKNSHNTVVMASQVYTDARIYQIAQSNMCGFPYAN